jgi:hypothetical protein
MRLVTCMTKEEDALGKWLSAALDDPNVCDEMKADIRAWFDSKTFELPERTEEDIEIERQMWESLRDKNEKTH